MSKTRHHDKRFRSSLSWTQEEKRWMKKNKLAKSRQERREEKRSEHEELVHGLYCECPLCEPENIFKQLKDEEEYE